MAGFEENDVVRLLQDAGIIRHRGKIEAGINNARRALELEKEAGSLAAYVWSCEPDPASLAEPYPASSSAQSIALSKDLKKRGWKFAGPTTVYAFMQAMGLGNDHAADCASRAEASQAGKKFRNPTGEASREGACSR